MTEEELHKALYHEAHSKPEYIICAAIHWDDGVKHEHQPKNIETGFVICGRRHHNCFIAKKMSEFSEAKGNATQGFLTSKDIFLNREDAAKMAVANGQCARPTNCLFSEDLY